jgi:hypothetical protein
LYSYINPIFATFGSSFYTPLGLTFLSTLHNTNWYADRLPYLSPKRESFMPTILGTYCYTYVAAVRSTIFKSILPTI